MKNFLNIYVFTAIGWGLFLFEMHSYNSYKAEVEATVKAQQAITAQIEKQHDQVIKRTTNDYQDRINAINRKYDGMLNNCPYIVPNTNTKQNSSPTTGEASNNVSIERNLIKDCAMTTNTLVTLQEILINSKD